jgi:hypothetical protein
VKKEKLQPAIWYNEKAGVRLDVRAQVKSWISAWTGMTVISKKMSYLSLSSFYMNKKGGKVWSG